MKKVEKLEENSRSLHSCVGGERMRREAFQDAEEKDDVLRGGRSI